MRIGQAMARSDSPVSDPTDTVIDAFQDPPVSQGLLLAAPGRVPVEIWLL